MIKNTFKQLWFSTDKIPEIRTSGISSISPNKNQVRIKAVYSLVSAGTEKIILTNRIHGLLAEKMRVPYMSGNFDSDFTYGYSMTGQIVEGPDKWLGRNVHVLHPHQEIALVFENDVLEIPETVGLEKAALLSNLETIVNAIWDSDISLGDNILIIGAGIIGLLLITVLKEMPGIQLTVIESNDFRRNLVDKMNVETYKNIPDQIKDYTIAFNTSGSPEGLQSAINHTSTEGRIIELSWYGSSSVELHLGDSFHYGRKMVISSQVSQIPGHKQFYFNIEKRKKICINLLKSIDFSHCLNKKIPFEKAPSFYKNLVNNQVEEPGILFSYKN